MLVRIDANAPREAVKMALTFAAENGYAVDFRSFGPSVKSSKPEAVRQSETVRQSKTVRQPKAVKVKKVKKTPKAESKTPEKPGKVVKVDEADTTRELAKFWRMKAETGPVKLPKDVYADLRSKDPVRMKAAIKAASLLLNPEERWCDRDPSTLMMALRAHEEFMHGNPLLDASK